MCKPSTTIKKPEGVATNDTTTKLACLSIGSLIFAVSITMPYLQARRDSLNCDAICYGSMTSVRSILGLIGSLVMGRLSDVAGFRKVCLLLGTLSTLISMMITGATNSISGLWVSMICASLFQQNFSILKAVVSETSVEGVGFLGMSVGLAFMVGPLAGALLVKTFDQANMIAIVFVLVSGVLLLYLPSNKPMPQQHSAPSETKTSLSSSMLNTQALKTPGTWLFVVIRLCMGLAYHVFGTVWTVSLKDRFDFGPRDHGKFMSFIGLVYALSQGVVGKMVSSSNSRHHVPIILACCTGLGLGRYMAFQTTSIVVVYCLFGIIVTALGVMNTILTMDTKRLSLGSGELGSIFGLLSSAESTAGIFGPVLGGLLKQHNTHLPLQTTVSLYAIVMVLTYAYYDALVLDNKKQTTKLP